jgi:hypothetical protein
MDLGKTGDSGRLVRILKGRHVPAIAALVGVVLTLPALGVGFALDDYYHRVALLELPEFRALLGPPSDMFRFFRGDPARTLREMDVGFFPWWTDPLIKGEMLQSLTVLTHRLDYRLWPDSPLLMHCQNLLWYALLVSATAVFYRRIMGIGLTAGLAALLFAIDDAHGTPAGWIANRNSLIATTFGVLTLLAHDSWRHGGRRGAAILAPALFAAALFSKEEGIAACAYLFAYAVILDSSGPRRGLVTLVPYAIIVVVWRALRDSWGYGIANVGLYIDPKDEPARFVLALAWRAPILLFGQWGVVPADLAVLLGPTGKGVMVAVALVFLAWIATSLYRLLVLDRIARFWALGMLLAIVPVCATDPMDRLLTATGIGAFGLLARFLTAVFVETRPEEASWRRKAKPVAWTLAMIHLVLAPLALPVRAGNPVGPRWIERGLYVQTPFGPEIARKTVVIVNPRSAPHAGYLVFVRAGQRLPVPAHTRVLAPGLQAIEVLRVNDRTISVRPDRGYLRMVLDRVFRTERRPFHQGERVSLSGMTAEVEELTSDRRPAAVAFRFDVPLEDDSLVWIYEKDGHFDRFTPPAAGQRVRLPAGRILNP